MPLKCCIRLNPNWVIWHYQKSLDPVEGGIKEVIKGGIPFISCDILGKL